MMSMLQFKKTVIIFVIFDAILKARLIHDKNVTPLFGEK